jgi:hypothetical protein
MQQQRFLCGAEPDILKTDFSFTQDSSLLDYSDVSVSSWLTTFRTPFLNLLEVHTVETLFCFQFQISILWYKINNSERG